MKKPRTEKLLESILAKHEEQSMNQQNNLLESLSKQRMAELVTHRKWESEERDKQREWEKKMIEWQTSQTNQMIATLNTNMADAISKVGFLAQLHLKVLLMVQYVVARFAPNKSPRNLINHEWNQ